MALRRSGRSPCTWSIGSIGFQRFVFFAPGGQDRWGGGAALQRFLKLEVRLEAGAKRGEEEGGDVVGKVLVAQVLPGSII